MRPASRLEGKGLRHGPACCLLAAALMVPALAGGEGEKEVERLERELAAKEAEVSALRAEMAELRRLLEQGTKKFDALSKRVRALEGESAPAEGASGRSADDGEEARRLDDLEEQMADIEDRVGSRAVVNVFDAESLDIGGIFTQGFTFAHGDGSSEASFNQTQFEMLLRARVARDWSFFTALAFQRESDLLLSDPSNPDFRGFENRIHPILLWANYQHSDSAQVQMGRFITPHGIINIEHFPPVLLDLNQPQFLRPFEGASIFPNFTNGVHFHGRSFRGRDNFQYHAYVGAFSNGDADDVVAGGRLAYEHQHSGTTLGFNYHAGKRQAGSAQPGHFSIVGAGSLTTNAYDVLGADILYDKGRLLWKNEAHYSFEDGVDDRVAAYTQPAFRVSDRFLLFYRYDYFDPGQGLPDSVEQAFGFNLLPRPTIRIRAAYFFKDFELRGQEEDAGILQLSATFSF